MAESAKGKAAVKLSDTRLRRRRVERIADAKAAKAEEGSLLAQAAAEAEATKSAKAARELKPNVWHGSHDMTSRMPGGMED